MALFVIFAALHYQIAMMPSFKPSSARIEGHSFAASITAPGGGQFFPDGAILFVRGRF
jgi:hypothetical protein